MIWLVCTESTSVGKVWLACTESWSVLNALIGSYGSRSLLKALIGWPDLLVLLERSDWTIRLVGPDGAIWLDDPTCWSWWNDLIGRSNLLVLKERSDWKIRGSVFGRLQWSSCFATSDSSSRTTRKRYAKCVLFCDEFAVQSAVARETDKTTVSFYINYSTRGGVLKLCTMLNNWAR